MWRERRHAVLTTLRSDAHSWNLVVLERYLVEQRFSVRNLRVCVPPQAILQACLRERPALLVVSTLNGHGFVDGLRLIELVREHGELRDMRAVVGGLLGCEAARAGEHAARLVAAGFDEAFPDGTTLQEFGRYLETLPQEPACQEHLTGRTS
jgi:methylaspartate mutase sigma subunit